MKSTKRLKNYKYTKIRGTMATEDGMRIVSFSSSKAEMRGFQELMMVGKTVRTGTDGNYLISAKECNHLKAKGIGYKILKKL